MSGLNLRKSKELYERARKIIPGASQTGSKRPESFAPGAFPIYIQRGKGSHVWDVDGNEYIDYISGVGPISLGYCYPAIDQAIKKQLKDGIIFSLMHPVEIEAAQAIIDSVPCAEMVRFFKTGAEATAAAVRLARAYTGREKIANFGYHGWLDVWTAELIPSLSAKGVPKILKDYIFSFSYNDFDSPKSLKKILEEHKKEIACIVMSPISYYEKMKDNYLQWVRELADKYGALLVFDEIVTGFRLSLGGAQEYFRIIPDLACFAKGVASGPPVTVLAGKRKFMEGMKALQITTTYGGEALSLAAIVAAIKEYREKNVSKYLWEQGEKLMQGLNKIAKKIGIRAEWVGYAPISMFRFLEEERLAKDVMSLFLKECAKRGVLFRRGGPVYITYSHTDEDIEKTLEVGNQALQIVKKAKEQEKISSLLKDVASVKLTRRFA